MWECGLKHSHHDCERTRNAVTPYVGVWIETDVWEGKGDERLSLLMWECGLKHDLDRIMNALKEVTPYVGVWIETRQCTGTDG